MIPASLVDGVYSSNTPRKDDVDPGSMATCSRGGERTMPRQPDSSQTFLFTDIEGSTQNWERHAEPMHDALDAHDEILASVIARHDGELFNHTGDGICAAFDSPESALRAAVDAQLAFRNVAIGDAALKVRMGI